MVETGRAELEAALKGDGQVKPREQVNTVSSLLKPKQTGDQFDTDEERAAKSNRFYDHEKAFKVLI